MLQGHEDAVIAMHTAVGIPLRQIRRSRSIVTSTVEAEFETCQAVACVIGKCSSDARKTQQNPLQDERIANYAARQCRQSLRDRMTDMAGAFANSSIYLETSGNFSARSKKNVGVAVRQHTSGHHVALLRKNRTRLDCFVRGRNGLRG